jgi:hypothetical protein
VSLLSGCAEAPCTCQLTGLVNLTYMLCVRALQHARLRSVVRHFRLFARRPGRCLAHVCVVRCGLFYVIGSCLVCLRVDGVQARGLEAQACRGACLGPWCCHCPCGMRIPWWWWWWLHVCWRIGSMAREVVCVSARLRADTECAYCARFITFWH